MGYRTHTSPTRKIMKLFAWVYNDNDTPRYRGCFYTLESDAKADECFWDPEARLVSFDIPDPSEALDSTEHHPDL